MSEHELLTEFCDSKNFMSSNNVGIQKSIGNYVIEKTIGSGTFGKVKLGRHVPTGMKVAIKVLEKQRIVDAGDIERISREIHILKLVRHPHIVKLYEIVESQKQLYLIMEFAAGGELFDYIVRKKRLSEQEACKFFRQLVSGLSHMHSVGIAHRDLKPENLLLDSESQIKIVDFGLSNRFNIDECLKTACGSPCYASPEMIAGKAYDPRSSDIWSAGVILYAMTCGYLPFEDSNTSELYKKIMAGDFCIPNHISRELRFLIKGILTTDPSTRMKMDDIQRNHWFQVFSNTADVGISVNCGVIACTCCDGSTEDPISMKLDEDVLAELTLFDIPLDYLIKCLRLNKHNHATTTYYLLVARKRMGLGSLRKPLKADSEKVGRNDVPIYSLATPVMNQGVPIMNAKGSVSALPLPFKGRPMRLAPSTIAAITTARRHPTPEISGPTSQRRSELGLPNGRLSFKSLSARPEILPDPRPRSRSPSVSYVSSGRPSSARPTSSRLTPSPALMSSFARPTASSSARERTPVTRAPFGSTAKRLETSAPSHFPTRNSSRIGAPFGVSKPFAIPISVYRTPIVARNPPATHMSARVAGVRKPPQTADGLKTSRRVISSR